MAWFKTLIKACTPDPIPQYPPLEEYRNLIAQTTAEVVVEVMINSPSWEKRTMNIESLRDKELSAALVRSTFVAEVLKEVQDRLWGQVQETIREFVYSPTYFAMLANELMRQLAFAKLTQDRTEE